MIMKNSYLINMLNYDKSKAIPRSLWENKIDKLERVMRNAIYVT